MKKIALLLGFILFLCAFSGCGKDAVPIDPPLIDRPTAYISVNGSAKIYPLREGELFTKLSVEYDKLSINLPINSEASQLVDAEKQHPIESDLNSQKAAAVSLKDIDYLCFFLLPVQIREDVYVDDLLALFTAHNIYLDQTDYQYFQKDIFDNNDKLIDTRYYPVVTRLKFNELKKEIEKNVQ